MNRKNVWIFESSAAPIKLLEKVGDSTYIFEGLAADFERNENGRLYSKDDYLKHLDYLGEKITSGSLWGELDHPERYNVLVKEASHIIKELRYDEPSNTVKIKIELFDNEKGNHVKGMVDKGAPVYISSRASGFIDEQGNVILEKIYTYDIVNEPGFKNAKLERMNESLGITNEALSIYEMRTQPEIQSINTKTETMNTNKDGKLATDNENSQQAVESVTVESFNQYTENTSKLFEGFKTDLAGMKTLLDEAKLNNPGNADVTKMSEQLEAITTNFNTAMDMFEQHKTEHGELHKYTATLGQTVNGILEWAKKMDEKMAKADATNEKLADHINLVTGLMNENLEEVEATMTDFTEKAAKINENLSAIASVTNEMVPQVGLITESVNELIADQGKNIQKINSVTKHYDTLANIFNESAVEKAVYTVGAPKANEDKSVFTVDIMADNAICGTAQINKAGYTVEVAESYKLVEEQLKNSTKLKAVIETAYAACFGVDYSTVNAISQNNLTDIGLKVDEAIAKQRQKNANAGNAMFEHKYPFIKVVSEESKAKFFNLSEAKQTRVAKEVHEKTLLKSSEIENAVETIAGFDDAMLLLEEKLTGTQVERWNGLDSERKDIVFSMFKSRNIRDKFEFDNFFESLEWRNSQPITSLNEQKHDDGDKTGVMTTSDEDRYMDARLGLN